MAKHSVVCFAYSSCLNLADAGLATILEGHIDLIPSLSFLQLFVRSSTLHIDTPTLPSTSI